MITSVKNRKIWNEFIDFLEYEKKMQNNTLVSYKRDIKAFFDFCVEHAVCDIKESTQMFDLFMENLRKSGKSPSTISRNIASLRSLFRFLKDKGYTEKNPTRGVKYEKREEKEDMEILSVDEIDRLILSSKGESFKALRDEAIIEMLYACGLKVSEIINLKKKDLFLKEGYIKVEDGDEVRYVPMYKGAVKAVKSYLDNGRPSISPSRKNTTVFLNRNAEPMTRQGLWKILKTYGKKAGIEKEITPHLIRRSMTVHLLENGANANAVKDMLGHKSINYTKKYAKGIKPSVIDDYIKAHPKA